LNRSFDLPHPTPPTLFFAGTDTDVGKTYVASLIAAALLKSGKRVGVYKPVASDCRNVDGQLIAADAVSLWEAAGRPKTMADVCPQRYVAPLSPPAAAAAEGKRVDAELLRSGADVWIEGFDVRIVEGAGGLFSPLADGLLNIDLAKQFDSAKLLIVAANRLGVIHQVLATCEAGKQNGITPSGIILCQPTPDSDESVSTNRAEIERYSDVPVIGSVAYGETTWCDLSQIE
jgi:dethiobiotin synthetase